MVIKFLASFFVQTIISNILLFFLFTCCYIDDDGDVILFSTKALGQFCCIFYNCLGCVVASLLEKNLRRTEEKEIQEIPGRSLGDLPLEKQKIFIHQVQNLPTLAYQILNFIRKYEENHLKNTSFCYKACVHLIFIMLFTCMTKKHPN